MNWYPAFLAAVFVLWALSVPADRNALRVVLVATLASKFLVSFLTHQIPGAWKLAVPGAVEVLTILALLQFARNRTGLLQIACLVLAWLVHAVCYLDIALDTDFVYSRYETIILLVAIAQILVCYETIAHSFSSVAAWIYSVRVGSSDRLPAGSVRSGLLRREGASGVEPDRPAGSNFPAKIP